HWNGHWCDRGWEEGSCHRCHCWRRWQYRLRFGYQRQAVEISFRNPHDIQAGRGVDRNTLNGEVTWLVSHRRLLHQPLARKKPAFHECWLRKLPNRSKVSLAVL